LRACPFLCAEFVLYFANCMIYCYPLGCFFTTGDSAMKRKAITIGLLALAIAGGARANTLVYCSEGSPEGFNPQLFTSGTQPGGELGSERRRQALYLPPAQGRGIPEQ
jgi:hypothetical protein